MKLVRRGLAMVFMLLLAMAATAVADDPCWPLAQQVVPYFRRSAEHGSDIAQVHLGLRYLVGRDVPQDYEEAAKWLRRAADQGQEVAQHSLGEMYAKGEGDAARFCPGTHLVQFSGRAWIRRRRESALDN